MDRRSYLGALAAAGVAGAAGCVDAISGVGDDSPEGGDDPDVGSAYGDGETVLSEPEEPRGDPIHPIYGQEFPDFSIPDPLADEEVSRDDFVGDRAFLMTFVFTSCQDECGTMVRMLQLVQEDAAERGYADDVAFLAMTFDPETDDADALREYGERHDVDLEAGNWHFLRPESQEEALSLVNDTFGSPVEVVPPEEHDHDDHDHGDGAGEHDDGDHDHEEDHDHDEVDGDTTTHYYMIFLVNEHGVVERSYPNAVTRKPIDVIEHTRTVVE